MKRTATKMNPKQVEEILQEARINAGFVGDVEKLTIKNLIESAKANSRFADKILLNINPIYVHIPFWQRDLNVRRAEEIGKNYMAAKWELPKVYCHEGKLMTGEGQHRIYGAFCAGKESVAMEFVNISEKEAIEIFLMQGVDRGKMTPADMLKAAIVAEKPEWVEFQQICHDNGVNIKGDCNNISSPIGTFTPILDGVKECKIRPERFDVILKLLKNLQWGEGSYNAKTIRSFKQLFAYYGEEKTARIILNKCKGREYFENNIAPKQQYATFDYLSEIIANEKGNGKGKPKKGKTNLTSALRLAVSN